MRYPLPDDLPITYLIQNYLEKNFPDEIKKRQSEDIEEETIGNNSLIPVMFLNQFLLFPGAIANLNLFEPRYVMMIENIMQREKVMGVITKIADKFVGFTLEVLTCIARGNVYIISAKVKQRLSVGQVSPFNGNEEGLWVPVNDVFTVQGHEQILWATKKEYLNDIVEEIDVELQNKLFEFTTRSINLLRQVEYIYVNQYIMRENDLTFFMLNVLKIGNEDIAEAFLSKSYNKRMQIIEKFVQGKRPNRFCIRIAPDSKFQANFGYLIFFLVLLILYIELKDYFKKSDHN